MKMGVDIYIYIQSVAMIVCVASVSYADEGTASFYTQPYVRKCIVSLPLQ